jgi:predicted Co/Zn/Cd cation transporter (cation efflux family)
MVVDSHVIDEQRLLKVSLYANGVLVLMPLGFAMFIAIIFNTIRWELFDENYSLTSFFMTSLTFKIAKLVVRSGVRRFHFGRTTMKPTLNRFKPLVVCLLRIHCFCCHLPPARKNSTLQRTNYPALGSHYYDGHTFC